MKILHTSDWHLGQNFFDFDRNDEHEKFLDTLYNIANEHQPDAIVVSGDIFDTGTPPIAAQELYNRKMIRISELKIPIVVTAGNHDSALRLELNKPLWSAFSLTVVGKLTYDANGTPDYDRLIVHIPDKGFVVALPHINKFAYPEIPDSPDATLNERMEHFHNTLLQRVAVRNTSNLPVVMMAHLAVSENLDRAEYDERMEQMDFCDATCMGQGWDYLALGHIHLPSKPWNKHLRYCGSPIPLSFDETAPRSISIVEITHHGGTPAIETVDIPVMRKMLTIPAEPKPLNEAVTELQQLPGDEECYVRMNLLITDIPDGDTAIKAHNALAGKKARYCGTKLTRKTSQTTTATMQPEVSVTNINNDPIAIAKAHYQQKFGTEMDETMVQRLQIAINEVKKQKQQ